jgi:hypothetical protein
MIPPSKRHNNVPSLMLPNMMQQYYSCKFNTKFSIAVEPGPCTKFSIDFSPELGMQAVLNLVRTH